MEFSEEEVTEYLHRDKQKEATVLEWIAKVIQEPLQVLHLFNRYPILLLENRILFVHGILMTNIEGLCPN